MKKLLTLLMAVILCFALAACGNSNEPAQDEPAEPLNLTGIWTQTNSNSDDTWQEAVIEDGTITINWISDGGDTKSLYWAGTFDAPTEAVEEYTWTSNNDHEQTDSALLASGDDTKEFTYKDGVLSYEASAMGSTTTVELEKK